MARALRLAGRMNIPFFQVIPENFKGFVLVYSQNGLQLVACEPNKKMITHLFVDFIHGKNGYRLARNLTTRQPLARAVGIKPGIRPIIFDATAGLGADGFVLASLGCEVTLCERNPVVFELLKDGLRRGVEDIRIVNTISGRMQLIEGDAVDILNKKQGIFDTVYLDPMYPHRNKSALNRQAMRALRKLVGDDVDGNTLLVAAMAAAKKRVVVKRPANAPHLAGISPSHITPMKNSRFDVYLS